MPNKRSLNKYYFNGNKFFILATSILVLVSIFFTIFTYTQQTLTAFYIFTSFSILLVLLNIFLIFRLIKVKKEVYNLFTFGQHVKAKIIYRKEKVCDTTYVLWKTIKADTEYRFKVEYNNKQYTSFWVKDGADKNIGDSMMLYINEYNKIIKYYVDTENIQKNPEI